MGAIAWRRAFPAVLIVGLIVGCTSTVGSSSSAAPSASLSVSPSASALAVLPSVSPYASPSEGLTPTPTRGPDPTSTTIPRVTPSATAPAGALDAWDPPIDTTVTPAFRVNDFVTSVVELTPVSPTPGGAPYRYPQGDSDPTDDPVTGYGEGLTLIVLHGPVVVDGEQWYLLAPAQLVIDVHTGWAPIASPENVPWLGPAPFPCPRSPFDAEELEPLALTDGLPGCFGANDVTVTGDLTCSATPDPYAVGPAWLTGGTCSLAGTHFTIYGLDAALAPGRYAVTGRFDDPDAAQCIDADQSSTSDGLHAVLHCRRGMVATSAVAVR
jgi:hypothetical protein